MTADRRPNGEQAPRLRATDGRADASATIHTSATQDFRAPAECR